MKIDDCRVKTNHRVINLNDQESTLNGNLGYIPKLNQYVSVSLDKTDDSGRTYILESESIESLEYHEIMIQYTTVVDLPDYQTNVAVKTEKITITDKVIELSTKPQNIFELCPILNFGYGLIRSLNDGVSIKIPTGPYPDDDTGKSIQMLITDDQLESIKNKEVTVQYTYEYMVEDNDKIPVPCHEIVTFTNGSITLSNTIKNVKDESPFLNFQLASTVSDNPLEFSVCKTNDNVCGLVDFTAADLALLEGQEISVQYFTTIDSNDAVIDINLLDSTRINGFPIKFSMEETSALMKRDDKLQILAYKAADSDSPTIIRNGDIVDGEFTVINE